MSNSFLEAQNLSIMIDSVPILRSLNFAIQKGEIVGIAGPNGSGKSTLIRALFGALKASDGEVRIEGNSIQAMRTAQIAKKLSVVSQFEDSSIRLRVMEMVLLGRSAHKRDTESYTDQDRTLCENALKSVNMFDSKLRYIDTLSGGERQRVLIARALVQACPLMLLDEPTNHLDIKYQHQILQLVRSLVDTAVIVLHDLNLLSRYCDKVILLNRGCIVAKGETQEILTPEIVNEIYDIESTLVIDKGKKQFIF